jgi:predicted nucleic acid-binding protein
MPIPANDLWLAAAAMETGFAGLITYDRHFTDIAGLVTLGP